MVFFLAIGGFFGGILDFFYSSLISRVIAGDALSLAIFGIEFITFGLSNFFSHFYIRSRVSFKSVIFFFENSDGVHLFMVLPQTRCVHLYCTVLVAVVVLVVSDDDVEMVSTTDALPQIPGFRLIVPASTSSITKQPALPSLS